MMIVEDAELHRLQRTFRQVLDAFAYPGVVCSVEATPDCGSRPASLTGSLESVVRLFVDQAVTFGVADVGEVALANYVTSETHSVRVPACDTDFIIVPARADASLIRRAVVEACRGTLASPEKGATILMGCTYITQECDNAALHEVEVRGPGVKDVNTFYIDRSDWAFARTDRKDEFPCGIEIILVDPAGNLVAVPRSSQIVVCDGSCEEAPKACSSCVQEVC